MTARRVLVTGASTPLGSRIAARLRRRDDVRTVVDVDARAGVVDGVSGRHGGGRRSLVELIEESSVDTIVHAGMCPSRGGRLTRRDADVVSTQQLTAAVSGRESPVRVVVAVSSSDVYVPRSSTPLWRSERETLHPAADSAPALVLEAERYLRDLAERQPHISVAVLRLADLAGAPTSGSLASLWQAPFVPYIAGYDPPIQVLHVDDAARAVEHAAVRELAGTLNVAGAGVVTWRATPRLVGRPALPGVVVPDAGSALLARLGVPHVPIGLADVLRFGRCLDTTALDTSGFHAQHTTESSIGATRRRT